MTDSSSWKVTLAYCGTESVESTVLDQPQTGHDPVAGEKAAQIGLQSRDK